MGKAKSPVAAPLTPFIHGKPAHFLAPINSTPTFRVSAATKTSMTTAVGARCRNTARFGFHTPPSLVGRLTAMATGFGFRPGAGLGWTMLPGVLLHSITAAG